MKRFETQIRVRYGEVDQMGFLYHARYVDYFDVARTEMMRSLGISNFELEERGIMLPVVNVEIKYGNPAHYDDLLTLVVTVKEKPSARITFHYDVFRPNGEKITTGAVTLCFMDSSTKKAVRPPADVLDLFEDLESV